ncbi:hypothetical protein CPAV1605_1278 [seawater metagenome]|uniref:Uncharacterized protein n=1 Tax=seawater metagenome TaxID=1561972 RepID=A0A5E8CKD9_9ZZZZ
MIINKFDNDCIYYNAEKTFFTFVFDKEEIIIFDEEKTNNNLNNTIRNLKALNIIKLNIPDENLHFVYSNNYNKLKVLLYILSKLDLKSKFFVYTEDESFSKTFEELYKIYPNIIIILVDDLIIPQDMNLIDFNKLEQ